MVQSRRIFLILTLVVAVLAITWPGIAGLGHRAGLWGIGFGLVTMTREWWPYLIYLSMGLGLVTLLMHGVMQPRRGSGIIIGIVALTLPFLAKTQVDNAWAEARKSPPIHDITTDMLNPPMFTAAIMDIRNASDANPADYVGKLKKGRNGEPDVLVSELQANGYSDIVPIEINASPASAYQKALDAVNSLGWAVVTDNSDAGIIEATDTTFWYGFKDDIIVRVQEVDQYNSVVDVRSLSRVGGSDLGKNASRIREFRAKLSD